MKRVVTHHRCLEELIAVIANALERILLSLVHLIVVGYPVGAPTRIAQVVVQPACCHDTNIVTVAHRLQYHEGCNVGIVSFSKHLRHKTRSVWSVDREFSGEVAVVALERVDHLEGVGVTANESPQVWLGALELEVSILLRVFRHQPNGYPLLSA